MKPKSLLLFSCFILPCSGFAQADASNLTLSTDSATGAFELSFWGEADRTFFIQFNPDLVSDWHYLPVIEQGFDEWIVYGFWISGETGRSFFRLRHTDQAASDPYLSVFGGDGIPSGWKLENGLDPFADYTGLSPDGSSLTYWEHWQASLTGGDDPAGANPAGLIVYAP